MVQKALIIMTIVTVSALSSCSEKESVDYRDVWTGEYVGTLHSQTWRFAGDTTYRQDTTYDDRIAVVKSSNENNIMYAIPMRHGGVFCFKCDENGILYPVEETHGYNLSGYFSGDSLCIKRNQSTQAVTAKSSYRLKKYEYQSWEY